MLRRILHYTNVVKVESRKTKPVWAFMLRRILHYTNVVKVESRKPNLFELYAKTHPTLYKCSKIFKQPSFLPDLFSLYQY